MIEETHLHGEVLVIRKIVSGALALVALPALAADPDRPAYYDEGWLKINQYSPVEGFESHGSYGWHLGVGVIQTEGSGDKTRELPSRSAPTQVPRLFLTHGTSWPLDFGLSFARLDEGKGRQFGAHLQWTIFEGFQKPAVAIRVARMQADGLSGLEKLETESAMLGLSYGFLRYFNFALGVGQQRHRLDIRPLEENNAFGLSAGWREQIEKTESVWTLCLKTHLFTPFASLGIERVYTHPRQALTIAKLSYML
jgi:hypothetical protein